MSESSNVQQLNRELSWLEFNRRVLAQAKNESYPIFERLRFFTIFYSNLDEFFMKRVGALNRQMILGRTTLASDGLSSQEQLELIRLKVLELVKEAENYFSSKLSTDLQVAGVSIVRYQELNSAEREQLKDYFELNVFPVLTPLAVDPGHPFPYLSNLSSSIGVFLKQQEEASFFARVKIPSILPQLIPLPKRTDLPEYRFISLSDLIIQHLDLIFPQAEFRGVMRFRVTRNTDLERDEEDVEDLLEMIEDELRNRRFARVIRLEYATPADDELIKFLTAELELAAGEIYQVSDQIDIDAFKALLDLDLPQFKFEPWKPLTPQTFSQSAFNFKQLCDREVLVHHPYESFTDSVLRFVQAAVEDKDVLAIKMTIYRTGDDSPFLPLLKRAAAAGKQVVCVVELKASSDEERNISAAVELEESGVHVVYGVVGLKTHAKSILVIRKEEGGVRSYAHIGTGNYNVQTSKLYTDLGLFTADPEITADLVDLFHFLTGRSQLRALRKLLVAPYHMQQQIIALIEREIAHAECKKPASIIFKINSLDDPTVIAALVRAANAGVELSLIVRGSCLFPLASLKEAKRVKIISIIGRFLEHSRIFYFRNGAIDETAGEVFLGSADMMSRNLLGRVEVITPVEDAINKESCLELLKTMLADKVSSWQMQVDGSYIAPSEITHQELGTQEILMSKALRHLTVSS